MCGRTRETSCWSGCGQGSGLQPAAERVWRGRSGKAPKEELLGCSWGLHDPPVAPLIALIQVFKAFAMESQSPFP